jgi:hypothetical protein
MPATPAQVAQGGTYGLPIPSLVLGIICVLALLDDSPWDSDTLAGGYMFAIAGLVLGIISVARQAKGRGMAIAGIVMCSITLLALVGQ